MAQLQLQPALARDGETGRRSLALGVMSATDNQKSIADQPTDIVTLERTA